MRKVVGERLTKLTLGRKAKRKFEKLDKGRQGRLNNDSLSNLTNIRAVLDKIATIV